MRGISSVTGCRTRSGAGGFEMNTLQGHRGGSMGGLTVICGGGTAVAVMWTLMTVVVSHRERHSGLGLSGGASCAAH